MRRLRININKLFPAAAYRVKILDGLKRSWASVVGPALVRHSFPCNLGVDEITVAVDDKNAANMITRMKGNITRALTSRWSYNVNEKFSVKIIIGAPKQTKRREIEPKKIIEVKVDEEKVNEYMKNAPAGLPEDINFAISHLRVFMEARRKICLKA